MSRFDRGSQNGRNFPSAQGYRSGERKESFHPERPYPIRQDTGSFRPEDRFEKSFGTQSVSRFSGQTPRRGSFDTPFDSSRSRHFGDQQSGRYEQARSQWDDGGDSFESGGRFKKSFGFSQNRPSGDQQQGSGVEQQTSQRKKDDSRFSTGEVGRIRTLSSGYKAVLTDGELPFVEEQPRRFGEEQPRRLGEEQPRRLGEEQPRRLGEEQPRRLGEEQPRRFGEEQPRRFDEEQPRRFGKSFQEGRASTSTVVKKEVFASKLGPGELAVGTKKVLTNVYEVNCPEKTVYAYKVEVVAFTKSGKELVISKPSRYDYVSDLRKNLCCAVFCMVEKTEEDVFGSEKSFYDGRTMLYRLAKLHLNVKSKFLVDLSLEGAVAKDFIRAELTINEDTKEIRLPVNVFKSWDKESSEMERSVLHFLDTVISQPVLLDPSRYIAFGGGLSYLLRPWDEGFPEEDCPELSETKFVGMGARKKLLNVENVEKKGKWQTALAFDTSKTGFHFVENVFLVASSLIPELENGILTEPKEHKLALLRQHLMGLYLEKRQKDRHIVFRVDDVTEGSANNVTFQYNGDDVSVFEYYKMRYNCTLRYPESPLLVSFGKDGEGIHRFFPMELCFVMPKQRVWKRQEQEAEALKIRSAAVVTPHERVRQNKINIEAHQLLDERNRYLKDSGVSISKVPISLEARKLPFPQISLNEDIALDIDEEKMWDIGKNKYFLAAKVPNWAIYYINSRTDDRLIQLNNFAKKLVKNCIARGLEMLPPEDCNEVPATLVAIHNCISFAVAQGCQFLIFIQDDDASFHAVIKEMERKHSVVTQDMKLSRMVEILEKNNKRILENFINKLNVKLGGLNYGIISAPNLGFDEVFQDHCLYLGISALRADRLYDVSSLSGKPLPAIVGYAANCEALKFQFVGDFYFCESTNAKITIPFQAILERVLHVYQHSRGFCPNEVVIYQKNSFNGQYHSLLDDEVPLIRNCLKKLGCIDAKITIILVDRVHNVRIYPSLVEIGADTIKQNLEPGSVVDTDIVHSKFCEFYLNSHRTNQGTAKVPRYTVIIDDLKKSVDELEMMTYTLTFCHQIVNLPTSTPTPLYVARRYAERGRTLLLQNGSEDAGLLNKELSYFETPLRDVRVNA